MSEPVTRSELDARFRIVEERTTNAKVEAEKGIERVLSAIASLTTDLRDFKSESRADAAALRSDVKDDYKNTRNTLIGVAVGAVGIVLAIIALAYTQQGNMTTANGNVLSAFQAGQASVPQQPAQASQPPAPAPAR